MNHKCNYSFDTSGSTDVGCVRKRNEDSILLLPEQGLWVVADGAGGHSDGHVASQLIIENLNTFVRTDRFGHDVNNLYRILDNTNNKLLELAESNSIIGSTVTVFFSNGEAAVVLWAGDSPLYRFRNNELTQVIEDHNRVDEFVRQGFSEEECVRIGQAQQLTHALGAANPLLVETRMLELQKNDVYLICSDGLTKELNDNEIHEILCEAKTLEQKQQTLMNLTLEKGSRDNTSVILVEIS